MGDEDELVFDEGVVKVVPFHKFRAEDALETHEKESGYDR